MTRLGGFEQTADGSGLFTVGGVLVTAINFGSVSYDRFTVPGYLEDLGELYDAALGYGWQQLATYPGYDNDNRNVHDRSTLEEIVDSWARAESQYWLGATNQFEPLDSSYKILLPTPYAAGTYEVKVRVGDSAINGTRHANVTANGTVIYDGNPPSAGVEASSPAVVVAADGIITLTFGTPGISVTALNYIEVFTT